MRLIIVNFICSLKRFLFFIKHLDRTYALYNFNGTINNTDSRSHGSRLPERQINVTEGDELEVIEDDDEQMWKVKNLRTNEIGLIPATIVGFIDGDLQRSSIISVCCSIVRFISMNFSFQSEISSTVCDCETW